MSYESRIKPFVSLNEVILVQAVRRGCICRCRTFEFGGQTPLSTSLTAKVATVVPRRSVIFKSLLKAPFIWSRGARQPLPRVTLAEVVIFLAKFNQPFTLRSRTRLQEARQLAWANCLATVGKGNPGKRDNFS